MKEFFLGIFLGTGVMCCSAVLTTELPVNTLLTSLSNVTPLAVLTSIPINRSTYIVVHIATVAASGNPTGNAQG